LSSPRVGAHGLALANPSPMRTLESMTHARGEPRIDGEGGPLVFIVDDDYDSRETARMVLEEEGYSVEVAPNGQVALEMLSSSPRPTLMLVDLMMPVMDGAALLSALEASPELSTIPVLVMTASGPDPRTTGLRYPVLRKPFDLEELMRLVTERSPRLWDEEDATDETSILDGVIPGEVRLAIDNDATPRVGCKKCERVASTRCVACGDAFCRRCIDAGPDGRCATCWRAAHP
jgi:CheY-like chemotaxis protein